jgi:hypothetical protein
MNELNLHALSGAYVLDALDGTECERFEAHLPNCAECCDEVSTLREAITAMALGDATAPPAQLHGAVLAEIARTPQVGPDVAAASTSAVSSDAPTGTSTIASATPTPIPAAVVRIAPVVPAWRRWPAVAAAAAVLVGGITVGGSVLYRGQQASIRAEATHGRMMRIVSAPDAVSHDLNLGTAHVVTSGEMGAAVVMGEDVPIPEHGTVYQVWMMRADGTAAAGPTFMPEGGAVMAIAEGDLSAVSQITVTEEPKGGSISPTGTVVARAAL